MSPEHGTGGHAGSSEGKDSPQMSLFEDEGDDPAVIADGPADVSGLCPREMSTPALPPLHGGESPVEADRRRSSFVLAAGTAYDLAVESLALLPL